MTTRSPEAPRSFQDSGTVVTLDVHGCTRAGAVRLIHGAVREASARGRSAVAVIHGMGSDAPAGSIRGALRSALESGELAGLVTGSVETSGGGRTVLSLRLGGRGNPRRIQVQDLMRQ